MWINIIFFSSISFVLISYKTIWPKTWSWYKTHWKWNLEELKLVFSKRCVSKIWGGSVRSGLKILGLKINLHTHSTPSPWKRRKTTSSAILCATGAWGSAVHNFINIILIYEILIQVTYISNWRLTSDLSLQLTQVNNRPKLTSDCINNWPQFKSGSYN